MTPITRLSGSTTTRLVIFISSIFASATVASSSSEWFSDFWSSTCPGSELQRIGDFCSMRRRSPSEITPRERPARPSQSSCPGSLRVIS